MAHLASAHFCVSAAVFPKHFARQPAQPDVTNPDETAASMAFLCEMFRAAACSAPACALVSSVKEHGAAQSQQQLQQPSSDPLRCANADKLAYMHTLPSTTPLQYGPWADYPHPQDLAHIVRRPYIASPVPVHTRACKCASMRA